MPIVSCSDPLTPKEIGGDGKDQADKDDGREGHPPEPSVRPPDRPFPGIGARGRKDTELGRGHSDPSWSHLGGCGIGPFSILG